MTQSQSGKTVSHYDARLMTLVNGCSVLTVTGQLVAMMLIGRRSSAPLLPDLRAEAHRAAIIRQTAVRWLNRCAAYTGLHTGDNANF